MINIQILQKVDGGYIGFGRDSYGFAKIQTVAFDSEYAARKAVEYLADLRGYTVN